MSKNKKSVIGLGYKDRDVYYSDYEEMFQEGFSDPEISHELGVDEEFVHRLRTEYESEY